MYSPLAYPLLLRRQVHDGGGITADNHRFLAVQFKGLPTLIIFGLYCLFTLIFMLTGQVAFLNVMVMLVASVGSGRVMG